MTRSTRLAVEDIVRTNSLGSRKRPVDVFGLAAELGVRVIERQPIASDAMLIHRSGEYKIVVNDNGDPKYATRQRFSIAHELGHLLLQQSGLEERSSSETKHRDSFSRNHEERLCDQIAAEILMPKDIFIKDGDKFGWSLDSLTHMSKSYQTSIPATARRMIDLNQETTLLAIWRSSQNQKGNLRLNQSYSREFRYGIPNANTLLGRRMWLVPRAMKAKVVQSGVAPIVDKLKKTAAPPDVPAEALAWGQGEFRQVMVFYYPKRELTDEMVALGNATWRT